MNMNRNFHLASSVDIKMKTARRTKPATRPVRSRPTKTLTCPERRPRRSALLPVIALFALVLATPEQATTTPGETTPPPFSPAAVTPVMRAPVYFEANLGQTDSQARFVLKKGSQAFSFYPDRFLTSLAAYEETAGDDPGPPHGKELPRITEKARSTVAFELLGASASTSITGEGRLPGVVNYYLGNDPNRWVQGAETFTKIRYSQVYDGIDLVFYINANQELEYDFELAPGADPRQIEIEITGGTPKADASGNLVIETPAGEMTKSRPVTFQGDDTVDSDFAIRGNRLGFALGDYDPARPLRIDPAFLSYSTYFGGSSGDFASAVAVDSQGYVYVDGTTDSANFPTVNPYQGTNAGGRDIYVSKFNPTVGALIWSTYLGGSDIEQRNESVLKNDGSSIALAGVTVSADFPVVTPYQATRAGTVDGFVSRFSSTGNLTYSTYLGGSGNNDQVFGVSLEDDGTMILAGGTNSDDFPLVNALQSTYGGNFDAFITKIASTGTSLVFSTYVGGSALDAVNGYTSDASGTIHVVGQTASTDFPLLNPYQSTYAGGPRDGFYMRINSAGSAIDYSTYLGGSGEDVAGDVTFDALGNVWIAASTSSPDLPTTPGAFQESFGGNWDVFLVEASGTTNEIYYASYLGGSGTSNDGRDLVSDIAVDGESNVYVVGRAGKDDFPTLGSLQTFGGQVDAFVTKLDSSGTAKYSTFLGGTGRDGGAGVAIDLEGNAIVVGFAESANFPVTPGAFQPTRNGTSADAFIARIQHREPISGVATGASWGSVSVYAAGTGELISYYCCLDGLGTYSVSVPIGQCSQGGGYKVLFLPSSPDFQPRWHDDKPNWTEASCVSSPASGVNTTLPAASAISGYVKSHANAANLNGAPVYVFDTNGVFRAWDISGRDGPGRYRTRLDAGGNYKVLVQGPTGFENLWGDGSSGFSEATPVTSPASLNFSLRAAGLITGQATQSGSPLANTYVSAYPSCGCKSPENAISDASGNYALKVPTTAASGQNYKIRFIPPAGQTRWYLGATGWGGAAEVPSPASGINQDVPA